MRKFILVILLVSLAVFLNHNGSHPEPAASPLPLPAHAHNDYNHDHPLWDALHYGFTSIEVDVRLVAGTLFVAHDSEDVRPFKTLNAVYLNPLQHLTRANNGSVYADGSGIVLMIDVKTDGVKSWQALQKTLKKHEASLFRHGKVKSGAGAVTIIVSGNRDLAGMMATGFPWTKFDGRLIDLKENPDLSIISMISTKWSDEFSWQGHGAINETELEKLKDVIESAHSQGRRVRFWDTDVSDAADQERFWDLLLDTGVDYIGTDKLDQFQNYSNSCAAPVPLPAGG